MDFREGDRVEVNPGYGWCDGIALARSDEYPDLWFVRYINTAGETYHSWIGVEHVRRFGGFA